MAYVFGYGSLLRRGSHGLRAPRGARPCRLHGHRRAWAVAMDNRRTLRGYKYYVDTLTGRRLPVFVSFLDIAPHHAAHVNGVLFEVPDAQLPALDRRERNYRRHDVADALDVDLGAPVWTYLGREDARDRHRRALAAGTGVVSREYVEGVRRGFGAFGEAMVRDFDRTTAAPPHEVRDLRRVDVP